MCIRDRYWNVADQVIDTVGTYDAGVEEFGLRRGSAEQMQMLAILDYNDQIFDGGCLFNLCTKCGLTMGAKLWWDREIGTAYDARKLYHLEVNYEAFTKKESKARQGKCHWRCLVEWSALKSARDAEFAQGRPGGATEMWDYNVDTFGGN